MLNACLRWYDNLLSGGVTSLTCSAEEYRQRRVFNAVMLCVIFICLFFVWRAFTWGVWLRVFSLGGGAILCAVAMVMLRCRASLVFTHSVGISGCFIAAFFAAYSSGGIVNAATAWLFVIPLIAGLVGGLRHGQCWALLVLASLIFLMVMDTLGGGLTNHTPEALRYGQDRFHQLGQWLIISVCMLSYLKEVNMSRQRLQENIAELQGEVEQRKLAEAQALNSNRTKGEFLTSMSHELRTPLNAILGFSERLKRRWTKQTLLQDEKDFTALESIHNNGESLLKFINDLIEISSLDNGDHELHCHNFALTDLLERLKYRFDAMAQEKKLALYFRSHNVPLLKADVHIVERVLEQLIGNALKHTVSGQVVVEASLVDSAVCETSQGMLQIVVEDTGPGIEAAIAEQLFEPYTPMAKGGHGSLESSGLAMALCHRLVGLHGGELTLETEVGQGSRFVMRLPVDCHQPIDEKNASTTSVAGP